MTWIVQRLIVLAWGLWFGGLMALFMAVSSVFATLAPDRKAAGNITAPIFHRFEPYQLALAGVLVAAAVAAWVSARTRARAIVMGAALAAAVLAVVGTTVITPQIERARETGQTQTPEFRRAHGMSMALYSAELACLLVGGLALPGAMAIPARTKREESVATTVP
jgi:hypothetical protein